MNMFRDSVPETSIIPRKFSVSTLLKTENCVICGKKAVLWGKYITGYSKRVGGYLPVKIAAGVCSVHAPQIDSTKLNTIIYDCNKHGNLSGLFQKTKEDI